MRQAFTLVELSIVLVILGLLVGGVLAGKSLIHASELRSISSDYAKYKTAMHSFKDKYFYLPGDMPNATHIWGALAGAAPPATGLDTTCRASTSAPTTTETCNGDGAGSISDGTSTYRYEAQHAWQQLGNAGLIEGKYQGATSPTANSWNTVIGLNIPKGKLNEGGYQIRAGGGAGTTIIYYARSTGSLVSAPVMTPADAWNIDTKMDDGLPGRGKLLLYTGSTNCFTGTAPDNVYALDYPDIACAIYYNIGL